MVKLLIFGTGVVADTIIDYYLDMSKVHVMAFINSISAEKEKKGCRVISLDEIIEFNYDYLFIAVEAFDVIYEQCINIGIPHEKIIGIAHQGSKHVKDIYTKARAEINKAFNKDATEKFLKKKLPEHHMFVYNVSNELCLSRNSYQPTCNIDSIRLHTLLGLAREIEINNIAGSVAELGVYKGDFACILNEVFPYRDLYLFDTFEGFSSNDIKFDKTNNYSSSSSLAFTDTSVELVLSKILHKDRCKIFKGYFPESAAGVDDVFSFVSLDADLYLPIYNGLLFFYERLSRGGYIMVHDFNLKYYSGVREAVTKFCNEKGIGYCPIPDNCGSVIITK